MNKYLPVVLFACCPFLFSGCKAVKSGVLPPENTQYAQSNVSGFQGDTRRQQDTTSSGKTVYSPVPLSSPVRSTPNKAITSTAPVAQPPLSMQYINDRIFAYGRKLSLWKVLDGQSIVLELGTEDTEMMVRCFRDLQIILSGYSQLREDMLQYDSFSGRPFSSDENSFDLTQKDILFLEGECGSLLQEKKAKSAGWEQRGEEVDLSQLETLIARYAGNREHEEVVQVWSRIPLTQVDRVDLHTRILYGNALMYLHQEALAAEVYQKIVNLMSVSDEQRTDVLSLRKVLADLYTASGNFAAAEKQYQEISQDYKNLSTIEEWAMLQISILERSEEGSPELMEYSALLRNYLGFVPSEDGYKVVWQAEKFLKNYPYSPVASNVDQIKTDSNKRSDLWFNGFLAQVDELAGKKQFQNALILLETMPEDIIDTEKQVLITKKADELTLAEAVERETVRIALMQELQRQWNESMLLIEQVRYDEAIDLLTPLLDSEYSLKASGKIAEVSLLAAKSDRRKAGMLFSRYLKTTDLESKKKLLIESRKLLADIMVKYPEIDIADKVLKNINKVESEMNKLDPDLLQQAINQEAAQDGQERVEVDPFATPLEPSQPITEVDLIEE